MNITKVDGAYSKELRDNWNEIRKASFNEHVSLEDMKNYILDIIQPAYINAAAKKRFIESLEGCETKKSVYWLCNNTIQKAMKYKKTATY